MARNTSFEDGPPGDNAPRWLLDMWQIEYALGMFIDADDYEEPYGEKMRRIAGALVRGVTGMDSEAADHTLIELEELSFHGDPSVYESSVEALARIRLATP